MFIGMVWPNMCRKLPYLMGTATVSYRFSHPFNLGMVGFPIEPSHRPSFSIWYDGLSASQSFLSASRKQSRGSWTSSPVLGDDKLEPKVPTRTHPIFWSNQLPSCAKSAPQIKVVLHSTSIIDPQKSIKTHPSMAPGDSKRWNNKEYLEPRELRGSSMAQLQSLQVFRGRVSSSASASMPMADDPTGAVEILSRGSLGGHDSYQGCWEIEMEPKESKQAEGP